MFDLENDPAGVKRQNGMPLAGRCFQYGCLFTKDGAIGYATAVIKIQDDKAATQRVKKFPGMRMSVGSNQGVRLHGDGQSLDRIGQRFVQIEVGSPAW